VGEEDTAQEDMVVEVDMTKVPLFFTLVQSGQISHHRENHALYIGVG